MNIKQLALTACALTLSAQANAALVVDQESLFQVSGGIGGKSAQSFLPSVNSISGIDVFMSGAGKAISGTSDINYVTNVTAKLYEANGPEDFNYISNPVLASDSFVLNPNNLAALRDGWAEFRWNPITITAESYYIVEFTSDNGFFAVSSTTAGNNPYSRGQLLEFNALQRDVFDLNFKTYYDDNLVSAVPVPAAAWLFGSGLIGLVSIARRKNT